MSEIQGDCPLRASVPSAGSARLGRGAHAIRALVSRSDHHEAGNRQRYCDGNVQYLAIMCALGVLVLFFAWAGIVARAGFGWQLGDHVTVDLQAEIFAHFQTLSTPQINRVGASAIIRGSSTMLPRFATSSNWASLPHCATPRRSSSLIFMLWLDLPLTLLSLLVLPLLWLATWVVQTGGSTALCAHEKDT